MKSTAAHFPPSTVHAQPLSLRVNFSWIAVGNAVEMACHWGLLVMLAHLGGLEMIGTVVLAFAVCAPVNALAYLGLRGAVVTDARREYQFGDYLALRLLTATLALATVALIVWAAGFEIRTALIILAVGVGEWLKSLSDIFHATLQQHERMDRIAISLIVRGLLVLGLLALGVYLTGDLSWAILGFPLAAAVTLLGYDLPNGSRMIRARTIGNSLSDSASATAGIKPRWDARTLAKLAWLTLPLGIVLMLIALTSSLPRYMISHQLGNRALGIFVSIFYLAMVGTKVVTAMGQSAGPRLAMYYAAGNTAAYVRLLGKLLAVVAALGTAVVLVVSVAGGPILSLLYDADFTPHLNLAVLLMLAGVMLYLTVPLGIAVEAMRRFKTHMAVRCVALAVLLGLLPGLIRDHGLHGAAAAMMISCGCSVVGCLAVVLWFVGKHRLGR